MAGIIAESGILKGLFFTFEGKESWVIGRDPDECDFVLEDPKVSRKHLIIRKTPEGYVAENLSSTNPARIDNQEMLALALLRDGNSLSVGGTQFRFFEGEEPKVILEPAYERPHETIYRVEEEAMPGKEILFPTSRFIFKVVAGPNTGAEIALELGREYMIGTDTTTCDIVFHDLSVSREHARLTLDEEGRIFIEDLGSRNGVIINKARKEGRTLVSPNSLISLGTSVFLIVDREAPLETIITPHLAESAYREETPKEEEREEQGEEFVEEEPLPQPEKIEGVAIAEPAPKKSKIRIPPGTLLLSIILIGLLVLFAYAASTLARGKTVHVKQENKNAEIEHALAPFEGVRYTYNDRDGKILIIGHISRAIEKSELMYALQSLPFIGSIEDHVVNDEAVWQEMNILISKNPNFQGVTMSSPNPGKFVISGYLKSPAQLAELVDFMNLNFNYLSSLEYNVIIEDQVLDVVHTELQKGGFPGVNVDFSVGQLTLTGYIPAMETVEYADLVSEFAKIHGVRSVKNFVVPLSPEQSVVDLNERYPGRYQVTGYSKHGNTSVNVVINGRLLSRGDAIDGMRVTSIQSNAVYFEKDGLKYKLEFNK